MDKLYKSGYDETDVPTHWLDSDEHGEIILSRKNMTLLFYAVNDLIAELNEHREQGSHWGQSK